MLYTTSPSAINKVKTGRNRNFWSSLLLSIVLGGFDTRWRYSTEHLNRYNKNFERGKKHNIVDTATTSSFSGLDQESKLTMQNIKNNGFSSMIWILPEKLINKNLELSSKEFEEKINGVFGNKLGKFKIADPITVWKINRINVPDPIKNRCVVIGDAAHSIYPLSGQGFNLSIGDIKCLSRELMLAKNRGLDFGEIETLNIYKNKRKINVKTATIISDGLDWLFTSSPKLLKNIASYGIIKIDKLNLFKKLVVESMSQQ